ncbi:MAG: hypothetical protein QGF09_04515 [Rhodospirillales bacterium]|jgi:hypothetical protein|nr:hypothetical protein [Rhodospirillales bacterium]
MDERYKQFKDFAAQPLSAEQRKQVWMEINDFPEEHFDAMLAANRERLSRVPKPGSEAPGFNLERLGPGRKGTGERVALSDLRGKPAGLVFGSYT